MAQRAEIRLQTEFKGQPAEITYAANTGKELVDGFPQFMKYLGAVEGFEGLAYEPREEVITRAAVVTYGNAEGGTQKVVRLFTDNPKLDYSFGGPCYPENQDLLWFDFADKPVWPTNNGKAAELERSGHMFRVPPMICRAKFSGKFVQNEKGEDVPCFRFYEVVGPPKQTTAAPATSPPFTPPANQVGTGATLANPTPAAPANVPHIPTPEQIAECLAMPEVANLRKAASYGSKELTEMREAIAQDVRDRIRLCLPDLPAELMRLAEAADQRKAETLGAGAGTASRPTF